MKLEEFNKFAEGVWEAGRADTLELHLTDDSLHELVTDVLLNGAQDMMFLEIQKEDLEAIRSGKIHFVQNPITRTTVRVTGGAPWDSVLLHGPVKGAAFLDQVKGHTPPGSDPAPAGS